MQTPGVVTSGRNLIGQKIRYNDILQKIRECEVHDYGTSDMRGEFCLITHTDDEEGKMMILAAEMNDIRVLPRMSELDYCTHASDNLL